MGKLQAMTGMDDVERQEIHGDPEILRQKNNAQCYSYAWCAAGIIAAVGLCTLVLTFLLHQEAHYYVAIDSVSGLDPARGLSFNLTLDVASRSYGTKACIKPGMVVDLSYGGVKLAASEAATGQLCVGPRNSGEQRVTAIAVSGASSAGQVLDRLAADMKQGAAEFDVELNLPAGSYGQSAFYDGQNCVSKCGGRRVGAATAWCDAPDQMPELGPVV